jgi:hypothetical protein
MAYATFSDFAQPYRTHADRHAALERLDRISRLLDTAFAVPFTGIRFGADSLVGLVPGIGDLLTTGMSAYIIYEAHKLGLPKHKLARMAANLAVDGAVGAVPLVGDLFDVAFKANRRNMRIVREHFGDGGFPFRA